MDWIKVHPEYNLFIKLHPVEKGDYVRNTVKDIKNVQVLDKKTTIKEALKEVSMVIIPWSAASVEAALVRRPSVVVNHKPYDKESDDYVVSDKFLYLEDFFPKRATNSTELHDRIQNISNNYDHYLKKCDEFVAYHLAKTTDSTEYIAEIIDKIYNNNDKNIPVTEVSGSGFC